MSTDLHAQLDTAVRARLELARAASGPQWPYMRPEAGPVSRFIDAMSPATVIRMCERDLAVIERHVLAYDNTSDEAYQRMAFCDWCRHGLWPCPDVRDLAVAYGLLDPTAGQ